MNIYYFVDLDFPNGIDIYQLKQELIAAELPVVDIHLDDADVTVSFSENVVQESVDIIVAAHSPQERQRLEFGENSIKLARLEICNLTNNIYEGERLNLNIVKNVENDISGLWSNVSGDMTGFDINTGIFTAPEPGVYYMMLKISTVGINNNPEIHILVKDSSDTVLFGTTNKLSTIHEKAYTYSTCSLILAKNDTLKFSVEVNVQNVIVDSSFKIFKTISCA